MNGFWKMIRGACLIAGTTVGAGMLGIPLITSNAGFVPAIGVTLLVWFFMLCTGLLFLEATLWMPDGSNILSICGKFLGKKNRFFAGLMFAFLYYVLMVAYFAAGAPLFSGALSSVFPVTFSKWASFIVFGGVFGTVIAVGPKSIDRVNIILTVGLVVSWVWLLGAGSHVVDSENLSRMVWSKAPLATPILFSAFGFHNVIPSLASYLKRDKKILRGAVILGTIIPLVVYILWQWLIIGALDEKTLAHVMEQGMPVTVALQNVTKYPAVAPLATAFSLFAIITSVLGVSFSLVDFLGDGLKIKNRVGWARIFLTLMTFAPPLIIAATRPDIFDDALGIAGGIGEAYLNGLLPIFLVWAGRYHQKIRDTHLLPGGKSSLTVLTLLCVAVIIIEAVILAK